MAAGWWVAAVAVSLDGVAVGAAYGAGGLLLPAGSLVLVGACSTVLALLGGLAGAAGGLLAAGWARAAGAVLLVALGAGQLARARRGARAGEAGPAGLGNGPADPAASARPLGEGNPAGGAARAGGEPRLLLRVCLLNVAVHVVLEPEAADLDRSGRLEAGEALLAGLSLGLDAAAAALAAGMAEAGTEAFLVGFPLLVGCLQILALAWGWRLGSRRSPTLLAGGYRYLPGAALVSLGLARLLTLR